MQVAPGFHSIGPVGAGYNQGGYGHAYLVDDGDGLTLVDTLWHDDARVILDYLWRIQRSPTEIKHIALTHAHRSHLGGVATLKRLSRAPVYAHETEIPIIDGRKRAHAVSLWPERPWRLFPFRVGAFVGLPKHVPCLVDETLVDGATVGPLEVVHTPGHTPGHLAFYWRERGALIAGDAIATWPQFGAGWPSFNLDEQEYRSSLDRLIDLRPDVVGPGHGEPILERTADRLASLRKRPPATPASAASGNSAPRHERVVHGG